MGGGSFRDVRERGSVKPVPAYSIVPIKFFRQRVMVGVRRHGLVKGRIEHSDLRHAWPECAANLNAQQIWRIMERRERNSRSNRRHDRIVDDDSGTESLPSVHHTVAYCKKLVRVRQLARLVEPPHHFGKGLTVVSESMPLTTIFRRRSASLSNSFDNA
jgi:hypothetical protein